MRISDLSSDVCSSDLANRAKSDFLANVSHELRTPLNAIIGFSEIIKDQLFGPMSNPRYREYAIDIHDSGTHLLSLINDIRSEEHTSELQSLMRISYAVFCLKKKKPN